MSVRVEKNKGAWTIIHSPPKSRNAVDPISADQLTDAFWSLMMINIVEMRFFGVKEELFVRARI